MLNHWLARVLPGGREPGDPWWVFRDADGQDNDWWPQLVTWSEGDIADTYGDAK